jgi:hypothetical protein
MEKDKNDKQNNDERLLFVGFRFFPFPFGFNVDFVVNFNFFGGWALLGFGVGSFFDDNCAYSLILKYFVQGVVGPMGLKG